MGGVVIETLRGLVGAEDRSVRFECRHCGTAVESPAEPCPACGTAEIARFVI